MKRKKKRAKPQASLSLPHTSDRCDLGAPGKAELRGGGVATNQTTAAVTLQT